MEHKHSRCPYCGRSPTSDEMYCYICEMSCQEPMKKHGKEKKNKKK